MTNPHAQDATRAAIERLRDALRRIVADIIEPHARGPARCRWCCVVAQARQIEHLEWCPSAIAEDALAAQPPGAGEPGKWPGGISDGLTLPCGVCGVVPKFDYHVSGECWRRVVHPDMRNGVVCLPCLDKLAVAVGIDVAESLERVQWTGIGKTVVLTPTFVHRYPTVPASGGSTEPPVIDLTKVVVEHLKNAQRAQAAPEPSATAPFVRADSGLTVSTIGTRTDAAPSLGDPETAAPAPCPLRVAAQRLWDAYANDDVTWRQGRDQLMVRLHDALSSPCAGRAGVPRKEES